MHVSLDTLRLHIDYMEWASTRLLTAAAGLDAEELVRDFGSSEKSVLGTLIHLYGADLVWIERVHGNSPAGRLFNGEPSLEFIQSQWPEVWQRWREFIAGLDDASVEVPIAYRDLKGNPYTAPPWQIVLHVVNHGTHHRGQAAGFIRALGKTPPPLDLIAYYRQLG